MLASEYSLPNLLSRYQPFDSTEAAMLEQLQTFLQSLALPQDAFERELAGTAPQWGHVTGSAWIVDEDRSHVVLLHHAKLGRWLQPGGHCDGQADVLSVACREAREETGLNIEPISRDIFDVDVHLIPEYWNTPAHFHYDVRFLLRADARELPRLSDESRAVRWVAREDVAKFNDSPSILRMVAKS